MATETGQASPIPAARTPVAQPASDRELRRLGLLDGPVEAVFNELVALVAQLFGTANAELSIVTGDQVWLKAAMTRAGTSCRPEDTLCSTVATQQRSLVVPDARLDPRFEDHPRVRDNGSLRFYAGVPLITADGVVFGALCAWDESPRDPSQADVRALEQFGRYAVALIELRRTTIEADRERLLARATNDVLEMIVGGVQLPDVLNSLATAADAALGDTRCSILLVEDGVIRDGAGPNLPRDYRVAFNGLVPGPMTGSCGTAAWTGEIEVVADIATDPRWAAYRHLALPLGLLACWSVPIKDAQGRVMATFALYYQEVRSPTGDDLDVINRWVGLAGVAITRARDMTALRTAATMDPLTGLVNRIEAIRRLDACPPGTPVAVLFIDLDQFKFVNDTLGHVVGDEILRNVADRLKTLAGPRDTVARLGGDEFLLIRLGQAEPGNAESLARRVVQELQQPILVAGRNLSLSASVGLALCSTNTSGSAVDLIGDADLAMYAAKRAGRNSVAVFTSALRDQAAGRLGLEADLHLALARGELGVAYQPTIDLATGQVLDVEALIRWTSPTRGEISPLDFIKVAEDGGLITAVGEFVLRRACRQLARWLAAGQPSAPKVVWVNVSPRQLRDPVFVDLVGTVLAETGLSAEHLGLEVTESTLIDDASAVRRSLLSLQALGIQIAIDDFGTGYSSLAQLERLPVDVIKLDRHFLQTLATDDPDTGIIEAVLTLARTMGLRVVAEGVETEQQRARLLSLGCRIGQGFLWCPPLPAEQLGVYLDGLPLR